VLLWIVWSIFTIYNVNVTTPTEADNVKSEVQTLLGKSMTQDNLLTLDTGKLAANLITLDPELKAVEVHRIWPHGIQVTVTQKQPALGWSTGNQNYLLDRDGTVIGSLPSGSTLPVVVDGSNLPVQKGQQVVTANFVTFCNDLLANLPSTGLSATGLRVQDTTFDLYVKTNKGYQLIFDTTRPAADEIADLKTVLHTLAGKAPTQYIDMRISGKAYYQ
jgi:cell division septal protein FtsQ